MCSFIEKCMNISGIFRNMSIGCIIIFQLAKKKSFIFHKGKLSCLFSLIKNIRKKHYVHVVHYFSSFFWDLFSFCEYLREYILTGVCKCNTYISQYLCQYPHTGGIKFNTASKFNIFFRIKFWCLKIKSWPIFGVQLL